MRFVLAFFALLTVAPATAQAQQSPLGPLPATFEGVIPCADCPGIRQRIQLQKDGRFRSRMIYLERKVHFDETGTWAIEGTTLVLTAKSTMRWAIQGPDAIAMLDQQGQPIVSAQNYTLKRVKAAAIRRATLVGPRWMLAKIGDQAVTPAPSGRAPFLQFAENGRLSGDAGCNRLTGGYKQDGQAITIGPVGRTMMACVGPAMETEQRFVGALERVKAWSLAGATLTLTDGTAPLLRFVAR